MMDVELSEQFCLSNKKYPLCGEKLEKYYFSHTALQYKQPPKEVSVVVQKYIYRNEKALAIYHHKFGWFVMKEPNIIVAWWEKKK